MIAPELSRQVCPNLGYLVAGGKVDRGPGRKFIGIRVNPNAQSGKLPAIGKPGQVAAKRRGDFLPRNLPRRDAGQKFSLRLGAWWKSQRLAG